MEQSRARQVIQRINESSGNKDKLDVVSLDVPSLIRLLEVTRENIDSDDKLHELSTAVISLSKDSGVITIKDLEEIIKTYEPESD